MGKNLKGKKCGKGICQRKDGKYAARYTAKDGSRREKHFDTLPEARNWLADAQYNDTHDICCSSSEMTVDAWFDFWMTNLISDLAPNTQRNYRERYRINVQPVIGKMRLGDVKPMHCKIILNRMEAVYAGSTIRQAYITMGIMFRSAVMNDMIIKHPMDGIRYTKPVRASGVMPKVLQKLLGHSSIKMTMDRYVHVTDDSLSNAVKQFEQGAFSADELMRI